MKDVSTFNLPECSYEIALLTDFKILLFGVETVVGQYLQFEKKKKTPYFLLQTCL